MHSISSYVIPQHSGEGIEYVEAISKSYEYAISMKSKERGEHEQAKELQARIAGIHLSMRRYVGDACFPGDGGTECI